MLRPLLFAVALLGWCTGPAAQQNPAAVPDRVPVYRLPAQDNHALLARERDRQRPDRPDEFAVALPVDLRPGTAGEWTTENGRAIWRLRISSPGAHSLNLGFSEYRLPEGAELYLSSDDGVRRGPFTASDNEGHATFWSPLLTGDRMLLELRMPSAAPLGTGLRVATINHDFSGVADVLSGSCNVDVACGAADGFPEVDRYRDVIRSVAAYTLEGRNQCTGFLVNNASQDGRPYFITAAHCRVTAENAASVVVYWNFQNSTCRPPGSPASADAGDGTLDVFNTGATLRARYDPTDLILLELEEPVNPRADAFFAGWSAELPPPADGGLSVHHPNVEEKRIALTDQATTLGDRDGEISNDGLFLRTTAWDLGTTERGSSGAPFFDKDGRARGHLFGGFANCATSGADLFGSLNADWVGGGTPSSQLAHWLDPCGSGTLTLDGLEQTDLPFLLSARSACLTRCVGDTATFLLRLGEAFADGTRLTVIAPGGSVSDVPATLSAGESFILRLPTLTPGSFPVAVEVTDGVEYDRLDLTLTVTGEVPAAPSLLAPAPAAVDVDPFGMLRWSSIPASGYQLQLGTDPDLGTIIGSYAGLTDTTLAFPFPFDAATTYYWRVRSVGNCGPGDWSAAASFTTADLTCVSDGATVLPLTIPESDTLRTVAELTVRQVGTIATLEVDVGLEHTYLGDVSAELVSPSGTVVRLFDELQGGTCPGRDLYATFTTTDGLSAADFAQQCVDGNPGFPVVTRSLTPLDTLLGEEAAGTWQLRINDSTPGDGGRITDFRIRSCGASGGGSPPALALLDADSVACANEGATARLRLDPAFGNAPGLTIRAGSLPLDNYNFAFDSLSRELTVTFTAWTLVGAGTRPLTFTVLPEDDGPPRRVVSTLTVLPLPTPARPFATRLQGAVRLFSWQSVPDAVRYRLELSLTEDFSEPRRVAETIANRARIQESDLPVDFLWRVVSINDCGSFPGPARPISLDLLDAVRVAERLTGITVYPNPSRGNFTVGVGEHAAAVWSVELVGTDGRVVRRWRGLTGATFPVTVANAPAGVYFLSGRSARGSWSKRLVLLP